MKFINIRNKLRSNLSCQQQQIFSGEMDPLKIKAMMDYKGSRGYVYNDMMRFPPEKGIPEDIANTIEYVKDARNSCPYSNYDYVYRRVNLQDMRRMRGDEYTDKFINDHKKGKIVQDNAFVSSSYDYNAYEYDEGTEQMVCRIHHYSGRDISNFPGIDAEKEVLLQPGFKALSVGSGKIDNIHWVELEEIIHARKLKNSPFSR